MKQKSLLMILLFLCSNATAMMRESDSPGMEQQGMLIKKGEKAQLIFVIQEDSNEESDSSCYAFFSCCFRNLANLNPQTAYGAPPSRYYQRESN